MEVEEQVPGKRCRVKNPILPGGHGAVWQYEERDAGNVRTINTLLVRVIIGKIEDMDRLLHIFRSVPLVQNDPS